LAGYVPVEMNASDARSKKLAGVCFLFPFPLKVLMLMWVVYFQNGLNINNTSLDGFITGGNVRTLSPSILTRTHSHLTLMGRNTYNDAGVLITDKTCLIMDEVDGMSAGDRGGVGALNALIKKTRVSDSLDLSFIALDWDMGMRLTGLSTC
jgi:replication factor C subunit 1